MTERVNSDHPPFSRVFVVCSKTHRDEDIRAAFERFGHVEDVWMVKDRMTKENKGICYVKYDKASSAAMAIEAMDGTPVGDEPKPIKVRERERDWPVCVARRVIAISDHAHRLHWEITSTLTRVLSPLHSLAYVS